MKEKLKDYIITFLNEQSKIRILIWR